MHDDRAAKVDLLEAAPELAEPLLDCVGLEDLHHFLIKRTAMYPTPNAIPIAAIGCSLIIEPSRLSAALLVSTTESLTSIALFLICPARSPPASTRMR